MRIQRRITLGIGILFTMILLLGIQSVSYVRQLSRATGTILADNYNSLQYAGEMLRSLNDIGQDSISRHALRENLALQQQNITEISEKETTAALERHVASLSDPVTEAEIRTVREDLFRIMELNMAAIRAKSAGVEQRADYAMWWLIAVAALCALIAGGILVWFPQSVLRPIDALKKGITQIANHNYRERLDFPGNREFESVAESFNDMAAKLDEYRRSSLDDLMTAKKRIEAIVDTLHEPIVGLGPDRRILFMNREALSVLNLREDAVGRDAAEVALSNDLLRRLVRGVNDTEKDADKEPLKIYADNKESYFQVENTPLYITPVGGREQQFVGNLIVLNNVTRFKELDSAKTNFISTVSHEMKTPISSILMSLQLLGDDRLEEPQAIDQCMFSILQAARLRVSKTEYISCPSCGRTLYDLQSAIAKIKRATAHLRGLKIGIMGCIVNGPGEMADADYGYVGAGRGQISLYKGKTCVLRNIPEEEAVERLVRLIKENGDWQD